MFTLLFIMALFFAFALFSIAWAIFKKAVKVVFWAIGELSFGFIFLIIILALLI